MINSCLSSTPLTPPGYNLIGLRLYLHHLCLCLCGHGYQCGHLFAFTWRGHLFPWTCLCMGVSFHGWGFALAALVCLCAGVSLRVCLFTCVCLFAGVCLCGCAFLFTVLSSFSFSTLGDSTFPRNDNDNYHYIICYKLLIFGIPQYMTIIIFEVLLTSLFIVYSNGQNFRKLFENLRDWILVNFFVEFINFRNFMFFYLSGLFYPHVFIRNSLFFYTTLYFLGFSI